MAEEGPRLDEAVLRDLRRRIFTVCGEMGLDVSHMRWCIQEYGGGNVTFCSYVKDCIEGCAWVKLAGRCYLGFVGLPNVVEGDEGVDYERIVVGFRNEYFDVLDEGPEGWLPNERARVERKGVEAEGIGEREG